MQLIKSQFSVVGWNRRSHSILTMEEDDEVVLKVRVTCFFFFFQIVQLTVDHQRVPRTILAPGLVCPSL